MIEIKKKSGPASVHFERGGVGLMIEIGKRGEPASVQNSSVLEDH
ncbi:MAG TPA: hypothetical protein VJ302_02645 [Blastocatellia bacterium]|nr:hypothetical protein [Blastocatellia bacterium]